MTGTDGLFLVWSAPSGKLLGKVFLGQHSANIAFVEQGLIILSGLSTFYQAPYAVLELTVNISC